MADRRYRDLEPDREAQLEDMKRRMGELGDQEGIHQLDASMSEWLHTEWAAQYSNPTSALIQQVTEQLKSAMADLGAAPERLITVRVGSTLREDVSAQMQPFSDGSGLVMISDSILTLSNLYSRYVGTEFSQITAVGRLRGMWRSFRAARKGTLGGDPAVLAGLLRYYNVNQRVYGLAAKLELRMEPAAEEVSALILMLATEFVIGHEIAHHVLGHSSASGVFSPGEHVPVCSENERQELDADILAYRATVRAFERKFAETPELAETPVFAATDVISVLGALVAMLAVHSTEQALFIRRGCSHPPAPVRASLLLGQLEQQKQNFAKIFLGNLLTATDASSMFAESSRVFDWEWFVAAPQIDTPHPDQYLRAIALLDTLQCQPDSVLIDGLERESLDYSTSVGEGARLTANGKIKEALLTWGIPKEKAGRICDSRRALAFHTLVSSLRGSFTEQGMPKERSLYNAIAAAKLAATSLTM